MSCQDLDDVKYVLKTLFDIEIVKIDERKWNDIKELFKSRHSIIHNKDADILSIYDKNKIIDIGNSITKIIKTVDESLFTKYEDSN